MPVRSESIDFGIGSRRLLFVRRQLERVSFSLEDILAERIPHLPMVSHCEGLLVRSSPTALRPQVLQAFPRLVPGAARQYCRRYIPMDGGFETYFSHFSAKTRNTLRRKTKRFAAHSGGRLDVVEYRRPDEVREFYQLALALSDRTYQQRLLGRGLPDDEASKRRATAMAEEDSVRGFILFCDGQPAAYLYLPVMGSTLFYAHLGYNPDLAALSPGTVLQLAALERLYSENRFRYFDFTEGDGAHKQLFGTHGFDCETFVMLQPTLKNRGTLMAHRMFTETVKLGKALLHAG